MITFILRGRDARAPCGGGHHDETACYWIVSESCLADTIEGVAGVAAKRIVEAFEDVRPRDADHGLVGVLAEIVVGEGRDARRVAGLDLATCAVVGKRYRRRVVRINGVRERSACVMDLRGSDPGEYVVVNMSLVLMQARSVGIWTWACQEASDGSALSP